MFGRAMTGMASACLAQVGFRRSAAITGCSTIAVASRSGIKRGPNRTVSFQSESARAPRGGRKQMMFAMAAWGLVRGLGRPTSIHKWSFYVDESVPFEESSRFVCTGAPVLRALGLSSFQLHRIDKRFTCTGGNIFLAFLCALVPGWPRLGFRGARPRGPMPECCRFA